MGAPFVALSLLSWPRVSSERDSYDDTAQGENKNMDETMDENAWLAERFEANRSHLRGIAYRMLGSLSDADDAIQETWIRLSRANTDDIDNLQAWLTTVVGRVC